MSYSTINCQNLVCKCEKKEVEKKIFIQCVDCIHGRYRHSYEPDCPCTDKTIKILICDRLLLLILFLLTSSSQIKKIR